MTLGDLSNLILTQLQQPGASFTVGGGGGPNWSAQSNPQFSQGLVEFAINEGYRKALGDLEDLELVLASFTLTSTATTYKYTIPASGYASISHVARVFYKPKGLPYTMEFRPGTNFISWGQYQRITGDGYLLPYSFGTQPTYATIDPLLTSLYFYPGSASAGDSITVEYSPLPGIGKTGCATLVAATDVPLLPVDCHMAIAYFALGLLWVRARELGTAGTYDQKYVSELADIRRRYTKKHHADTFQVMPFVDTLSLNTFS